MIPEIHSLRPLETNLSENRSNLPFQTDSSTSSKKISSSTSSTVAWEGNFQITRISHPMTLPLSNIKTESTELTPLAMKNLLDRDKPLKKRSNFTIEHLLSNSCPTKTDEHLFLRSKPSIESIFNKKKTKHFSDRFLHRIVSRRKPVKIAETNKRRQISSNRTSKEKFLSFIFDSFKDLIKSQSKRFDDDRDKFSQGDALEKLAEIALKLDTRQRNSIYSDQNVRLTRKIYENWLKICHDLVKQIYQKFQQKKLPKRLDFGSNLNKTRRHLLHVPKSISNLLKIEKNFLVAPTIFSYLQANEIRTNLEILLPNNDLVYEGTIQRVDQYDDLLLIRLNHERQTYLIPLHDLCRLACRKEIPNDFQMLNEGSRVCAVWSETLRGLHPAVVKKLPTDNDRSAMIELVFDDSDTGLIKLDEMRLLPADFQIKGVNLDEWRVSSFQIPSTISERSQTRQRRRCSSTSTLIPVKRTLTKKPRKEKIASSDDLPPSWSFDSRTSSIVRQDTKEIIRLGDCVVLHGVDKSISYIGKVLKFYRNRTTEQDCVRLQWYYSPEEIPKGFHKKNLPGALFESTHIDENPIATVRFKGTIYSSFDDYVTKTNYGQNRKDTDFYLVGHFNPTTGELKRFDTNKSKKRRYK